MIFPERVLRTFCLLLWDTFHTFSHFSHFVHNSWCTFWGLFFSAVLGVYFFVLADMVYFIISMNDWSFGMVSA